MPGLVEAPGRDRRHVAVVDGCGLGSAVRPPYDTVGAVVGGTVQTRKTAQTPRSPASSDSGTVRSPVTTSTLAGSVAAASGRRVSARTGTPASTSRSTTTRPTRPVAPVTSTGAVEVGFEPTEAFTSHAFEACALVH